MKSFNLIANGVVKPLDILSAVVKAPAQGTAGVNYQELRKRVRLLDAIENCDGIEMVLEDADYEYLVLLLTNYPFGIADKDLFSFIEGVMAAKSAN